MTEDYRQKDAISDRAKLGSFLSEYLLKQVAPRQKQWSKIIQNWETAVPETIARMCSIEGLDDGVLTIGAASQVYANEIRLISNELIDILNVNLGNKKIKKIKTVLKQGC